MSTDLQIQTEYSGEHVYPWRPGYGLPDHWKSTVDSDQFPYSVELEFTAGLDHEPRCHAIRLEAREGAGINARDLRKIPISRCVQAAIGAAALAEVRTSTGIAYTFIGAASGWGNPRASVAEASKLARPNDARTKDARLRQVAEIYKAAEPTGKPTQTVQHELHYSYSTAARLVMEARRRGFLPPAQRRSQRERGKR